MLLSFADSVSSWISEKRSKPSPVSPSLTKMIALRPSLMLPRWTAAD